jgi:hypothetical protein
MAAEIGSESSVVPTSAATVAPVDRRGKLIGMEEISVSAIDGWLQSRRINVRTEDMKGVR